MPSDNKEEYHLTSQKGSEAAENMIDMKRRKFIDKYGKFIDKDPKSNGLLSNMLKDFNRIQKINKKYCLSNFFSCFTK